MYIVSESRLVCMVHTYQMNRATYCRACILPGNLLLGLEFNGLVASSQNDSGGKMVDINFCFADYVSRVNGFH